MYKVQKDIKLTGHSQRRECLNEVKMDQTSPSPSTETVMMICSKGDIRTYFGLAVSISKSLEEKVCQALLAKQRLVNIC